MKFLKTEGRIVCLTEREDSINTPPATLPKIDLLIIQRHHKDELMNSHIWEKLMSVVNERNIIEW